MRLRIAPVMNIYGRLVLTFTAGIAFCVCIGSASANQVSNLRDENEFPDPDRGVHTASDHSNVGDLSFIADGFDEKSEKAGPIGLKEDPRPFEGLDDKVAPALIRTRVLIECDSKSPVSKAVPERSSTVLLLLPTLATLLIVKIVHRRRSRNS